MINETINSIYSQQKTFISSIKILASFFTINLNQYIHIIIQLKTKCKLKLIYYFMIFCAKNDSEDIRILQIIQNQEFYNDFNDELVN